MSLRSYHHDAIVLGTGFMVASTQRDPSSAFPVCRLAKKPSCITVPFPGSHRMSRTLEASPPEVDLQTLRKVILAASIGNFVEWFDFAVYGFLATILTREFFPSGDPAVGLLKTFAVFAVALHSARW